MRFTIWPDGVGGEVVEAIYRERLRQEELKRSGKFKYTCAGHELTHAEKLAVLAEEFGEVAREVTEEVITRTTGRTDSVDRRAKIRAELIQVAAVAAAWAESL